MTSLIVFWFLSLVALVGIVVYAGRKGGSHATPFEDAPRSFADFIAIELTRMIGHLSRGVRRLRPHGEMIIMQSSVVLKKGHDIFIEKIFGHIAIEKGKAASFFLKRIAEHKEALRQKGREEI